MAENGSDVDGWLADQAYSCWGKRARRFRGRQCPHCAAGTVIVCARIGELTKSSDWKVDETKQRRLILIGSSLGVIADRGGLVLSCCATRSCSQFHRPTSRQQGRSGQARSPRGMVKMGSLERGDICDHFEVTDGNKGYPVSYRGIVRTCSAKAGRRRRGPCRAGRTFAAATVLAQARRELYAARDCDTLRSRGTGRRPAAPSSKRQR